MARHWGHPLTRWFLLSSKSPSQLSGTKVFKVELGWNSEVFQRTTNPGSKLLCRGAISSFTIGYCLKRIWQIPHQEPVDSYSLSLSFWFYHNRQTQTRTHTHTETEMEWIYSKNVKYYMVSEFISLYVLNSNFQQYQKLLNTKKHLRNSLISTNILWDNNHFAFYANEEVDSVYFHPVPQSDFIPD
jgi:hypothetical protein